MSLTIASDLSTTHTDLPFRVSPARADHWSDLCLTETAVDNLRACGTHSESVISQLRSLADILCRLRDENGPEEALRRFFIEAPDHRGALDRLAAMHTVEVLEFRHRTKGHRIGLKPAIWSGWIDPEDPYRLKRVLTDLEIGLVRLVALYGSKKQTAVVGLCEAGASTGELHKITAGVIDTRSRMVHLPGGVSGIPPRSYPIPTWATDTIVELAENYAGTEQCILYTAGSDDSGDIQRCISMSIKVLLRKAGLGNDPSVSPLSFRHTAAREHYDCLGIDAAADFLGESNYQTLRVKVGHLPAPQVPQRSRTAAASQN